VQVKSLLIQQKLLLLVCVCSIISLFHVILLSEIYQHIAENRGKFFLMISFWPNPDTWYIYKAILFDLGITGAGWIVII